MIAVFPPNAPVGGITRAASPTRCTHPELNRSATQCFVSVLPPTSTSDSTPCSPRNIAVDNPDSSDHKDLHDPSRRNEHRSLIRTLF